MHIFANPVTYDVYIYVSQVCSCSQLVTYTTFISIPRSVCAGQTKGSACGI